MPAYLLRFVLLTCAAVLLAACGGNDDEGSSSDASDASDDPVATVEESDIEDGDVETEEFELQEIGDSGLSGTATIEPGDGDSLRITIELDDDTDTHGVEARYGSCEEAVDPGAVDDLVGSVATFTLTDIEDGRMEAEAELPDEVVREGSYSLVVYEGEDVDGNIAACAQVEVT